MQIFKGIAKGYTRFSINIDKSCTTCYNIRLLKVKISSKLDQKTKNGKKRRELPVNFSKEIFEFNDP